MASGKKVSKYLSQQETRMIAYHRGLINLQFIRDILVYDYIHLFLTVF